MKTALAAALAALLLAGCASSWDHPIKTDGEFYGDLYACERDAAPVQDPMRALEMKRACMRVKGWRER